MSTCFSTQETRGNPKLEEWKRINKQKEGTRSLGLLYRERYLPAAASAYESFRNRYFQPMGEKEKERIWSNPGKGNAIGNSKCPKTRRWNGTEHKCEDQVTTRKAEGVF